MEEKVFSFKKNIIESKLLISAVVLALFMSEILQVSFFRYIVATISTFMIILDYDENLAQYISDKSLICKKYKRSLFFAIESLFIGFIVNEIFWAITGNDIFNLNEVILKNTLIANIVVIIFINLIFVFFLEHVGFDKLKYVIMVLVISFMNNNFVSEIINKVSVVKCGNFANIIFTIMVGVIIFILGYYIFKKNIIKKSKFKNLINIKMGLRKR